MCVLFSFLFSLCITFDGALNYTAYPNPVLRSVGVYTGQAFCDGDFGWILARGRAGGDTNNVMNKKQR